ncbi:MAG: anaerobic ribonucleoside-triphosphate reductase activating protein [Lachnospiraceae bacterium]|nr:anaerobic ribonucleoside-triphosphate reductase activating protein [Lachnospiraceae bacterium]
MLICGLQKTTLLDFPGHVAATIFTGGCNFRCPFCHNGDLLTPDSFPPEQIFSEKEVLDFLQKRKTVLDGVCLTGGEPTLQPDLPDFIRRIKSLGLLVKLDTNGSRPDVLRSLLDERLPDYIAMDIKSSPKGYEQAAGIKFFRDDRKENAGLCPADIDESIRLLRNADVPYEFRTTVVRELHREEDFLAIGKWLAGARAYFLQSYRDSEQVPERRFSSYKKEEMEHFRRLLLPFIPSASLRGVD